MRLVSSRPPQTHGIVTERRPLPAATSTSTTSSCPGPAARRSSGSGSGGFPRAGRLGRVHTLCAIVRAGSVIPAAVCEHIPPVRFARLVGSCAHAYAGRSGRAHNAHRSLVVVLLLLIRPPADPRLRFVLLCWSEPRPAISCPPAACQPRQIALVPFTASPLRRRRGDPEKGVPAQPAAAQQAQQHSHAGLAVCGRWRRRVQS